MELQEQHRIIKTAEIHLKATLTIQESRELDNRIARVMELMRVEPALKQVIPHASPLHQVLLKLFKSVGDLEQ